MKRWITAACTLAMMTGASQAHAGLFDINLNFTGGLSTSQQQVFQDAENFWETHIIGYSNTVPDFSLDIDASGENIDGTGNVLGSAGPTTGTTFGDHFYALTGQMRFDTADLNNMESNNTLYSVIVHEMAHVIGFGTLWTYNNIYDTGTGQYTGAAATAAYQQEFDSNASFVPVELDGGAGTADGHWDETWAGPSSDIMTGYLESTVTISNTTMAAFEDLGYVVAYNSQPEPNDPDPSNDVSAPLAGAGMLALFGTMAFRRKRA